jgi:hypothetical protein
MTQPSFKAITPIPPQQALAPGEQGMAIRHDLDEEQSNELWVRTCILDYYQTSGR